MAFLLKYMKSGGNIIIPQQQQQQQQQYQLKKVLLLLNNNGKNTTTRTTTTTTGGKKNFFSTNLMKTKTSINNFSYYNKKYVTNLNHQIRNNNKRKFSDVPPPKSGPTTTTTKTKPTTITSAATNRPTSVGIRGSEPTTPVKWPGLVLMGLAGIGMLLYYKELKEKKFEEASKKVVTYGKPALGGPWTLVDHDGIPKTDKDFLGQWVLLYFGFTRCPDICPAELVKMGKVLDQLDIELGGPIVKPLFISVDPDRDTVGQMRHYAQDFHSRLLYLTGTRDQVAKATKAYRVYFSKATDADMDKNLEEDNYLVDHSIVLYLIKPNGEFADFFTQSMQVPDIVKKIVKNMDEEKITTNTN